MIPFEEAISLVLRGAACLATEEVALEAACGRVLAEDIIARSPLPAFSHSAMDGYAVASSFFSQEDRGPWTLPATGEARAGGRVRTLRRGTTCRIFTGAEIPPGADSVVKQEDVSRSGDEVTFHQRPQPGQNVRHRGADLQVGHKALAAGSFLTPGKIGLAASLDRSRLLVGRRPVVTVVTTGDELRAPGEPERPGSIAESNSFVVAALATQAGAVVRVLPRLPDDTEQTEQQIHRALKGCDLVITIGGASVGDHDLVRPALQAAGVTLDFWRVALKPGKPVAYGRGGNGARVLCLPGNPASSALTCLLFAVPLLRALQGHTEPRPRRTPLRIIGAHIKRPGREEYLRARLEPHDGELCAVLPPSQASGACTSFAYADALVVLAADRERVDHGDRLPVIRLSDILLPL